MLRRGLCSLIVLAGCGGTVDFELPPDAGPDAPPPQPARLVVSPPPGTFAAAPAVTVTIDDPDHRVGPLELWYTVDGSAPVVGTSRRAQPGTPITLDRSRGLRVFAADAHGAIRFAFFGAYLVLDNTVATFSSNLPVLVLWGEVAVPDSRLATFTPSSLSVFVPGPSGRATWPGPAEDAKRAGIKIRGSSTAGYPKHPWHLETLDALLDGDDKLALLDMPADADWALQAPLDFDRALMRNSLAFALSNAIERWAPRSAWAEVFIAGTGETVGMDDYVGVYEVTEMITRGRDRVAVESLEAEDVTEPDVTGGYIFKEDRLGPGESGFRAGTGVDSSLAFQNSFVLVDPDEQLAVAPQKAYLKAYLDELGVALTSPGFVTPAGKPYADIIDVDAFIDHHILNLFTKNPDAFRLSGYYHKRRGGPVVAGPVWDFDRTMGCSSDSRALDPKGWFEGGGTDLFNQGFYGGLFRDPAFRARYWARMGQLLKGPLDPRRTTAWVDAWAPRLEEAAVRNFTRWSNYRPRGGSYQSEVQMLEDWLTARAAWMNGCLGLDDPRTCPRM